MSDTNIKGVTPAAAKPQAPAWTDEQKATMAALQLKMVELGIAVRPSPFNPLSVGPVISIYRFIPDGATRVSQMENLGKDFSVVLGKEVLVKRMPGETAVSFAIPNNERTIVNWRDTANEVFKYYNAATTVVPKPGTSVHVPIPLGFGVDFMGRPFIEDLTQLPHLLIAGTSGGGKSTLMKSLIASIVYTMNSSTVNLVLSDTKGVEFTGFAALPHLLFPVATTPFATLEQMDFLVEETEQRLTKYRTSGSGATNIHEYNSVVPEQDRYALIAMVIDECADIMDLGKLADQKLGKILQKSRAAGIHMIAATQRPSVDVIKGSLKANLNARLTFRLPSPIDSRTVINTEGAEQLMMRGDMLYVSPNKPGLHRLHAPLASLADIKGAVDAAIYK